MERYDYKEAVKADVLQAIEEQTGLKAGSKELAELINEDRDRFQATLEHDLWRDDSVTGNPSGSYTCSTWKAEENLCHNWDLAEEAAEAFGLQLKLTTSWEFGAEYWDLTIRCYLLAESIQATLDELTEN